MTCNPTIEIMFSGRLFDYFAIFFKNGNEAVFNYLQKNLSLLQQMQNFRWSIIELLFSMQNSKKYEESIDFV